MIHHLTAAVVFSLYFLSTTYAFIRVYYLPPAFFIIIINFLRCIDHLYKKHV
jgi:hypothetical protein